MQYARANLSGLGYTTGGQPGWINMGVMATAPRCPSGYQATSTGARQRFGFQRWCIPLPKPAPAPAPAPRITVAPIIRTQVSPQISPVFQQMQDSPQATQAASTQMIAPVPAPEPVAAPVAAPVPESAASQVVPSPSAAFSAPAYVPSVPSAPPPVSYGGSRVTAPAPIMPVRQMSIFEKIPGWAYAASIGGIGLFLLTGKKRAKK